MMMRQDTATVELVQVLQQTRQRMMFRQDSVDTGLTVCTAVDDTETRWRRPEYDCMIVDTEQNVDSATVAKVKCAAIDATSCESQWCSYGSRCCSEWCFYRLALMQA